MTAAEIINKFGGQSALAKLLGKTQSTIQHWYNYRIPAKWQRPILDLAKEEGIDIKPEDFFKEDIPKAIYGAPDRPLKISNVEIPCYVLEDEKRVLYQRAMVSALGMARGGSSKGGGDRLAHFVGGSRIKPRVSEDLYEVIKNPIKFKTPKGSLAYGYEAEILAQICFAVLDAERDGKLQKQQQHIADQCRILIKGFAIVGINALVDEATGYQEVRDRLALQKILDKYLTDEWAKWTRRFPDDFYKHLFRLKNLPYPPTSMKKPQFVGHWTNDVIYSRLAPGVLKELKRKNPRQPSGYRKRKFHQYLTQDLGIPELVEHLSNTTFLMKSCGDGEWEEFKERLNLASPKYGDTMLLAFPKKKKKE